MWVILAELPSPLVTAWLIETRLGRKYTLALCFFLTAASLLPILFLKKTGFIVFCSMAKFFISICFGASYQITSEVYDSKNRVNGIGCGSMMSRVAGIILPGICNLLSNISMWSIYFFFCLVALIAGILHLFLPYDTKEL